MEKHLKSRGIEFHRYPNLSFDDETASFPIWTPTGLYVGFQKYRPKADKTKKNNPIDGRYYTYVSKGYLGIWGFESLDYQSDVVYVCEGVFKAVRLHRLGLSAIAVLGNDPKIYKNQIHLLNRQVIALCDNDDAGRKMAKIGHKSFVTETHLDDMTDEQARQFILKINHEV